MIFKDFGNKNYPTIILLHGGGLSYWSLQNVVDGLVDNYHVVTPIIDGHGEDSGNTFISIEDSANKLIKYIDNEYNSQVYAIGGLSIGAQIIVEALSKRAKLAEYAILESALIYPIKGTKLLAVPAYRLCYGLIKKEWFAKLQAKTLFVSKEQFEQYYGDSVNISKQSLINITLSNGSFEFKESLSDVETKVLIIVGSKELKIMKKSANKLNEAMSNSDLFISDNMGHGELSLVKYDQYLKLIKNFFIK